MKWRRLSLKGFLWRLVLVFALFWGGGIALFSVVPVPFSAVMAERQISACLAAISAMLPIQTGSAWMRSHRGWGWR